MKETKKIELRLQINNTLFLALKDLAELHNTTVQEIVSDSLFQYVEKSARSFNFIQSVLTNKRI